MTTIHRYFADQGLSRPQQGRVLGGVCAAFARRTGIDPWLLRILVVVTLVALPGSQLLLYPLAWILLPAEGGTPAPAPGVRAATPQDRR